MEPTAQFELLPRSGDDTSCRSAIRFAGRPTNVVVGGAHLEAQYRCSLGFLLLASEDTPFEGALHIALLDQDLQTLDALELSHPYAPGMIRNLQIAPHEALEFSFFGGDHWRLSVLTEPRRWSIGQLTPGVAHRWRRLLQKGYLSLSRLGR